MLSVAWPILLAFGIIASILAVYSLVQAFLVYNTIRTKGNGSALKFDLQERFCCMSKGNWLFLSIVFSFSSLVITIVEMAIFQVKPDLEISPSIVNLFAASMCCIACILVYIAASSQENCILKYRLDSGQTLSILYITTILTISTAIATGVYRGVTFDNSASQVSNEPQRINNADPISTSSITSMPTSTVAMGNQNPNPVTSTTLQTAISTVMNISSTLPTTNQTVTASFSVSSITLVSSTTSAPISSATATTANNILNNGTGNALSCSGFTILCCSSYSSFSTSGIASCTASQREFATFDSAKRTSISTCVSQNNCSSTLSACDKTPYSQACIKQAAQAEACAFACYGTANGNQCAYTLQVLDQNC